MTTSESATDNLSRFFNKLYNCWHHRTLPNGEYPKTARELIEAYPDIKSEFDVAVRVSQYTGHNAVMVRFHA